MFLRHHCSALPNVLRPQSTFSPSGTLPGRTHWNEHYYIPAGLTQGNLNLNPIYSPLFIPASQFIKTSRFI